MNDKKKPCTCLNTTDACPCIRCGRPKLASLIRYDSRWLEKKEKLEWWQEAKS